MIKFKEINKSLIASIVAGTITFTLVGCSKNENKNTEQTQTVNTTDEQIIYVENDEKKINLEKVLALTNEEETLFARYDDMNSKYLIDVFTNTEYIIYDNRHEDLFCTYEKVEDIFNRYVYIYNKKYNVKSISDYIFNITDDFSKYNSYDILKKAFNYSNNINNEQIELNNSELVDLKNVVALESKEGNILFAKYNNLDDKYITDVFTKTKYNETFYLVDNNLARGMYKINDVYYTIKSITTYPYIVDNVEDGKISKDILHQSFKKSNESKVKILKK